MAWSCGHLAFNMMNVADAWCSSTVSNILTFSGWSSSTQYHLFAAIQRSKMFCFRVEIIIIILGDLFFLAPHFCLHHCIPVNVRQCVRPKAMLPYFNDQWHSWRPALSIRSNEQSIHLQHSISAALSHSTSYHSMLTVFSTLSETNLISRTRLSDSWFKIQCDGKKSQMSPNAA